MSHISPGVPMSSSPCECVRETCAHGEADCPRPAAILVTFGGTVAFCFSCYELLVEEGEWDWMSDPEWMRSL